MMTFSTMRLSFWKRDQNQKNWPHAERQCYNCSLFLNSQGKGSFLEVLDLSHPVPESKALRKTLMDMNGSQCLMCTVTGDDFIADRSVILNQRIKFMYTLSNLENMFWKKSCLAHSILKDRASAKVVHPVMTSQGVFDCSLEQERTQQHFPR